MQEIQIKMMMKGNSSKKKIQFYEKKRQINLKNDIIRQKYEKYLKWLVKGSNIVYIVGKCRNKEKTMSTIIITKRNSLRFWKLYLWSIIRGKLPKKREKQFSVMDPLSRLQQKRKIFATLVL